MPETEPLGNTTSPINNAPTVPLTPGEAKLPTGKRPKLIIFLLVILVIIGGLLISSRRQKPNTKTESPKPVYNLTGATFAEYKEIKSTVKPSLSAYSLKTSELTNLNEVASAAAIQINADKSSRLGQAGFFTQPTHPKTSDPNKLLDSHGSRSDDMVDLYAEIGGESADYKRKPENAVFITSDLLLHTYHVLIDRTFKKIEEDQLAPKLKDLTQALFQDSVNQYQKTNDSQLKQSLARLSGFYLVPLAILDSSSGAKPNYFKTPEEESKFLQDDQNADSADNIKTHLQSYKDKIPADVFQAANDEIDLVLKAGEVTLSPLYGKFKPDSLEDYTQYTPRSHYAQSSTLRNYFRAMMWYGRHGFEVKSPDLTRDAILMAWQLRTVTGGDKSALKLWEDIYLPSVFFVGRSDDLTFYEYNTLLTKIYGENVQISQLSDQAKLEQFQTEALKLEGPKILSEVKIFNPSNAPTKEELLASTKAFRFMGQRFIPDSYMFSSLTQGDEKPDPETGQKLPSTPTALMVMSILGSKTADSLVSNWVTTNAPDSDKVIKKVMDKLKTEVQSYDEKTWTQNIYWAWLYNFLPLLEDHNDGYPMFMRGALWAKKSLLSVLGSWTELRHDTLLYAKQSYAEYGGGGTPPTPPPVPKGYVEPNLSFLTRLIALNKMTSEGLSSKSLIDEGQKNKFNRFGESLEFFKSIAEKELQDMVISEADFEKLRTIVRMNFPSIVWVPDGGIMIERDARVGIIADVHTDAKKQQILYEATGAPSIIYVAVKDKNGTRLTRGVTYSYYEFTEPLANRLTDEQWQARIYEGKDTDKIPPVPAWTNELVKP